MNDRVPGNMKFRDFAKEFTIGCLTHFLLGVAALVLLGGAAHYWGFSGRTLFVLVAVVLFFTAASLPWRKRKGHEEKGQEP